MATSAIALFTDFGFAFPAPWENQSLDPIVQNQPIVVLGAGTNIATFFTRLATRVLGIKNIIAVAGPTNTATLLRAGASQVFDRQLPQDELVARVRAAAGGQDKVVRINDCASWTHELAAALLSPSGPSRLAALHRVDEAKVQESRPLCKATLVQNTNLNLGKHAVEFWKTLPKWVEEGIAEPTAFKTLDGLESVDVINAQLDDYAAGKPGKKLTVHP
ncbi:uncharacterized protein LTR77_005516 [Saxophila tyrrhenica]|uniref:Uncharacterized protein n=1 Tax=Saxophila tyrrhenica TaxID=1690608 RepID=A0AAV9PCX8_9PEZI|nr:hypothetical protein LTR77_005516 [Saxophila tyrrhenica]